MQLALVAPFERGQQFGGSLRATAMAEMLEDRGVEVEWFHLPPLQRSRAEKLSGLLTLRPALVGFHTARTPPELGSAEAVLAVHSYMAPYLASFDRDLLRVLDFQNLEWRSLRAVAAGWSPRSAYLRWQALLMRRFERKAMSQASLSLFVTEEELELAHDMAPSANKLLIPNVLPRREIEHAEAIREARSREPRSPVLAYVGRLTYPPNRVALRNFLNDIWPRLRQRIPNLHLTVAGAASDADRRRFSAVPGVEARGFVRDLTKILRDASAVVLPFDAGGGSSLRVLFYALAEVPVVGSPAAFRGFSSEIGLRAGTARDWTDLLTEAVADDTDSAYSTSAAREAAVALQNATEPWDALREALRTLSSARTAA